MRNSQTTFEGYLSEFENYGIFGMPGMNDLYKLILFTMKWDPTEWI